MTERWEGRSRGDMGLAYLAMYKDATPWFTPATHFRGPSFEKWNGIKGNAEGGAIGSQNIKPTLWLYRKDGLSFTKLQDTWLQWGVWGRELDSPVYTPCMLNTWALANRDLRDFRKLLRMLWTHFALRAVPGTIKRLWLNGEPDGHLRRYKGPVVALAGDRWNMSYSQQLVGPMLALAIDWPGRRFDGFVPLDQHRLPSSPAEDWSPKHWWHHLAVMVRLAGLEHYEEPLGPRDYAFGLSQHEREVLRAVVRGSVVAMREALPWLQGFKVWHGHGEQRIMRTAKAAMTVVLGIPNSNKPGHPASRVNKLLYETIRPSDFKPKRATQPAVTYNALGVIAVADGNTEQLAWPAPPVLWDIIINPQGVHLKDQAHEPPFKRILERLRRRWLP